MAMIKRKLGKIISNCVCYPHSSNKVPILPHQCLANVKDVEIGGLVPWLILIVNFLKSFKSINFKKYILPIAGGSHGLRKSLKLCFKGEVTMEHCRQSK